MFSSVLEAERDISVRFLWLEGLDRFWTDFLHPYCEQNTEFQMQFFNQLQHFGSVVNLQ